jgi:hypothetical protein
MTVAMMPPLVVPSVRHVGFRSFLIAAPRASEVLASARRRVDHMLDRR